MKKVQSQKGFLGKLIIGIIALFIIIFGIFIYFKLPEALPGEKLYFLKGLLEDIHLSFNEFNYSDRALIYLDSSNMRAEEIKNLIEKRKYQEINNALENLIRIQVKALKSIRLAQIHQEATINQLTQLEIAFQTQHDDLQKLTFEVPFEFHDQINKTMDNIKSNLDELKNLAGKK